MRFYVSPEHIHPDKKLIEVRDRQEVHHIRDVMRLGKGLEVTVFDGRGREYAGKISDASRSLVSIEIIKLIESKKEPLCDIALYQAVPKKARMDFIIEKAVELGVSKIIPMITERTIPVLKTGKGSKLGRWGRIAMAAAKQCGRVTVPVVSGAMGFKECLMDAKKSGLVVFAALHEKAMPLKEILRGARPGNISVFVGPEGDFSQKEIEFARSQGCAICSLGRLVLRVDTAAIYILSCLGYEHTS